VHPVQSTSNPRLSCAAAQRSSDLLVLNLKTAKLYADLCMFIPVQILYVLI
jgi:hypothetical protein